MTINFNHFCSAVCFCLLFSSGCRKDSIAGQPEKLTLQDKSLAVANSVADHVIETGMNLSQINGVIAGASSGQTVYVQPGTYSTTVKIVMKAGVSLVKQTSTSPVFDAGGLSALLIMNYTTDMSNCIVSGIAHRILMSQILMQPEVECTTTILRLGTCC